MRIRSSEPSLQTITHRTMTPEVEQAIKELRETFPGHSIEVVPDKEGVAYVVVGGVELGEQFKPTVTWVGFHITFQYPSSDVYPHFVDCTIKKGDGTEIPRDGVSGPVAWQGRSALQLSRRSKRLNPATDTAALKLSKVIQWLKSK